MNATSRREIATRWGATWAALLALLLASWFLQSRAISWHLRLFPKTTMLLPMSVNLAMWLPILTGIMFILLSRRVLHGKFDVTRKVNILLVVLALFLGLSLVQQLVGIRADAYRILWGTTLLSVLTEWAVIAAVLLAYLGARRKPSLASRSCLNWLLSFYVVNVWCGSGISLIGP